ncbi:hypothetical protein GQ457_15G023570 [Hibiscus cannabinus]
MELAGLCNVRWRDQMLFLSVDTEVLSFGTYGKLDSMFWWIHFFHCGMSIKHTYSLNWLPEPRCVTMKQ